jgi:hypothetical protein
MLIASQFAIALCATIGRSHRPDGWLVGVRVADQGVLNGKRPSDLSTTLKPD